MAEGKLTIKQEKFCNKYLECGNASEAYRFAYDCSRMTDNVISVKASQLLSNGKVTVRVKQLQAQLAEKELITKEELIRLNVSIINADVLDFVDADMVDMKTEYGVRQVPSISFQDLKSLPPEKRRLPSTACSDTMPRRKLPTLTLKVMTFRSRHSTQIVSFN